MTQLVFIENGKTVTDSLTVAEVFGKDHDNVLRDIQSLGCSEEFSLLNFEESTYTNSRGRSYLKYIITQSGFAMLAMGYTGKEAMRFKEMYINEFNRMHAELETAKLPTRFSPSQQLQAILMLDERQQEVEQRVIQVEQRLENEITLASGQQRTLQQKIAARIYSVEQDGDARKTLFRQLYKEIKDRWQVASYKDVRKVDLPDVIKYVEAWVPIRREA